MTPQPRQPKAAPFWRQVIDGIDAVATPVLEGVVRSDALSQGLVILTRSRRIVLERAERVSRRGLHACNLPAASDINRMLSGIASVEHQLRTLSAEVEDRLAPHGELPGAAEEVTDAPRRPRKRTRPTSS